MLRHLNNTKNKARAMSYAFLRWTEKWTKTDMIYLAKGGFWLIVSQIFSSGIAFLSSVVFANLVSKELYGNYKYIISLSAIIGIFSLSGMNLAVTKAVAKGKEGTFKKAINTQLKWGALQIIASFVLFIYYLSINNKAIAYSMLIIGILSPIVNTFNTCIGFLNGKKDFREIYIYNLLSNLLGFIAMTGAILLYKNVIFLVFVYFVSNSISFIYLHLKTIKKYKPNNSEDPEAMAYGKHMSIINVASIIASNIDKILIFNFLGPTQLSIYYFAIAAPDQLRGLSKIISTLSFPKFSASQDTGIQKKLLLNIVALIAASTILVTLYILLSPFLYSIFFPKYIASVFYSQVFSLSLIAVMASAPLLSYVQAKSKIKNLYQYNIIYSIVQTALMVIITFFYGIMGAIIARIVSSVINLFILFIFSKKIKPIA